MLALLSATAALPRFAFFLLRHTAFSGYPSSSFASPATSGSKMSRIKSPPSNSGLYSQSMYPQGYPQSLSPPRRTTNNSSITSNSMQQSYMMGIHPQSGTTPPFSTMGPAVGYGVPYGGSSPPSSANYYQPPGGSGDIMTMGLHHSSLFIQQQPLSVLNHGPPIARPLLPLDYLQQGPVLSRTNPASHSNYHQNRTHSQADSPMTGVQVQSPVPSS